MKGGVYRMLTIYPSKVVQNSEGPLRKLEEALSLHII